MQYIIFVAISLVDYRPLFLPQDYFLSPPKQCFWILYIKRDKICKNKSWIIRMHLKTNWSRMSNSGLPSPSLNSIPAIITLSLTTSLPCLVISMMVKILPKRPSLKRIRIYLSLGQILPSLHGPDALQDNYSCVRLEPNNLPLSHFTRLKISLHQYNLLCYNLILPISRTLSALSLKASPMFKKRLLLNISRKGYLMLNLRRKQVKKHLRFVKHVKERSENGVSLSKKKASSKKTSFRSQIDDIVWQFSEEFTCGKIPKVVTYISCFHGTPSAKRLLFELLISTKIAYLASHPKLALEEQDETISKLLTLLKTLPLCGIGKVYPF